MIENSNQKLKESVSNALWEIQRRRGWLILMADLFFKYIGNNLLIYIIKLISLF